MSRIMETKSILNKLVPAARVLATGSATFILGFSQLFSGYVYAGDRLKANSEYILVIGLFVLPLVLWRLREKMDYLWIGCCVACGISFLVFLYVSADALIFCYLFIPTIIMGALGRKQDVQERLANFMALMGWIPAWFVPFGGLIGYHAMSIAGIALIAAFLPFIAWMLPGKDGNGKATGKVENPGSRPRVTPGEHESPTSTPAGPGTFLDDGGSLGEAGTILLPNRSQISQIVHVTFYLCFICGFNALIFGIFASFSWIDPNPLVVGQSRDIFARPYAPWDSILSAALVLVFLAWVISRFIRKTHPHADFIGFSFLLLAGVAFAISWELPQVPFFIPATAGVATYLGGLLVLGRSIVVALKGTILDKGRVNIGWFFISLAYFFGVVLGFVFHGIINRAMYLVDYISLFYLTSVIAGATFGFISIIIVKKVPTRVGKEKRIVYLAREKHPWKSWSLVLGLAIVLMGAWGAGAAQAHGTSTLDPGVVYMWGIPPDGRFDSAWCEKITHVTVGGVSWNTSTGEVYGVSLDETLANYYRGFGIKIMPVIGLTGEALWHLLKNTGGRLDVFCATFREALENSSVDGVSVDFEGVEVPPGEEPVTDDDWINTWERMGNEIFHVPGKKQYIFANYFGVGSSNSRSYVNRYFNSVDLHVQNTYESHWHLGGQGATTLASNAAGAVLEIYNHLENKSATRKIVLGLPLYGYRWVWGETPTIPFRDEYKDLYTTTSERFEPYNVTLSYANNSLIRWDPFSGAQWFEYKDELGRRCVAYFQGTEQLIQIMNAVKTFEIGGVMFWPGGNTPYPGLYELL